MSFILSCMQLLYLGHVITFLLCVLGKRVFFFFSVSLFVSFYVVMLSVCLSKDLLSLVQLINIRSLGKKKTLAR